ncbi:hypothetical protein GOBAR_DD02365 [Gossypium barbadense]|nr:hypothetical protein GOBAR_DD02365 [Gossypium barbadense]
MAKLTEQVERYEEMVKFMENVASAIPRPDELSVKEHNLLSVAYKNVIGARRASWRIVSSIEQKEEGHGNADHDAVILQYKSKIELLDKNLVPTAGNGDTEVVLSHNEGRLP